MNVSFTNKQKDYISSQVKSGDFQNASEVMDQSVFLWGGIISEQENKVMTPLVKIQ